MKADLIERLAQRAETEGLLDVAYAEVDSPLGKLLVATTPKGIVRLGFPTEDHDDVLDELAVRISPRVLEVPDRLDAVRRELDEYFEGRLHRFTAKLDWTLTGHGFRHEVLRNTAKIPYGRTSTYMEMATRACALTHWKSGPDLDILAAAYAEAGQFEDAVRCQLGAIEYGSADVGFCHRLELYKRRKPYRQ